MQLVVGAAVDEDTCEPLVLGPRLLLEAAKGVFLGRSGPSCRVWELSRTAKVPPGAQNCVPTSSGSPKTCGETQQEAGRLRAQGRRTALWKEK